jgi:inner membrane protein
MIAPTHITFAEFIYLLVLTTTGVPLNTSNALAIALASTLPDIDTEASTIGKALPMISKKVERKFGHRTLTHSVLFVVGLALILWPLQMLSPGLYTCLLAGYASHPLLDTMTLNGVKLFYPFTNVKCVFPLEVNNPHRYRLQTGSKLDKALGVFFLIGCIPTLLIAHQGYERFVRATQKNIESAVRDYNEFSRTSLVLADIRAHNLLTKEQIAGEFQIVGSLNEQTLVFKGTDGHPHSLGKEYHAEYVADAVVCRKGPAARTLVRSYDMSNQVLGEILAYIDTAQENHFFGTLTTGDPFSILQDTREFAPVSGSSGSIRFNHGSYDEIRELGLENLLITRGVLTVRTVIPIHDSSLTSLASLQGDHSGPLPVLVQGSFPSESKASIQVHCQRGDTVAQGQLLASSDPGHFFDLDIRLNLQKIDALEEEKATRVEEIDQLIEQERQNLRKDSLDRLHLHQLRQKGFAPGRGFPQPATTERKSRNRLFALLATRNRNASRINLQIQKLRNENLQLEARKQSAERELQLVSTVSGVVLDIRQSVHNSKRHLVLVIRPVPDSTTREP